MAQEEEYTMSKDGWNGLWWCINICRKAFKEFKHDWRSTHHMGIFRGVQGVATPPPSPQNGQSHSIEYSTIDVLSLADALIYIDKSLVVVAVMF